MTVARRLAEFLITGMAHGIPDDVAHESKRLLLNQLKASVGATRHPAIRILHDWATSENAGHGANRRRHQHRNLLGSQPLPKQRLDSTTILATEVRATE